MHRCWHGNRLWVTHFNGLEPLLVDDSASTGTSPSQQWQEVVANMLLFLQWCWMTVSAWQSGSWSRRTANGGGARSSRRRCGSDPSPRRRSGSWSGSSLRPIWPQTPKATTGNRSANSWWEVSSLTSASQRCFLCFRMFLYFGWDSVYFWVFFYPTTTLDSPSPTLPAQFPSPSSPLFPMLICPCFCISL